MPLKVSFSAIKNMQGCVGGGGDTKFSLKQKKLVTLETSGLIF